MAAAAAQCSHRRTSLAAPGLVQSGGTNSTTPSQPTIPGSPTEEGDALHAHTPRRGVEPKADSEQQHQVGQGEPILVEFLLVSGKRTRWTLGTEASVREVREAVWRGWPEGEREAALLLMFERRELVLISEFRRM